MHHFAYRNGVLHAEGVDLIALAEVVGTPFYCYASATLERHYTVFAGAFAGVDALVCYAMKANSNQAVIATLAKLGAGADVVSGGELLRARAAGIPPHKIMFSGVGKTVRELAQAVDAGVDMHIGSQIVELDPFGDAFALLADFVRALRADGHSISHIDLGGGLGIPYREDNDPPPDPAAYAKIVKNATRGLGCKLIFEPGRLIVGNAGILVTRVLYVKHGEAKTFVIVDAGMNDLV